MCKLVTGIRTKKVSTFFRTIQYKPTLKASTFAIRTSQRTDQKLQKSLLCHHTPTDKINSPNHDRKEGRSANIGFAKWRVKCFYDSLVQGSSSVFQMNICAEIPPLRKAENRCASLYRAPK
jgi:hypothetical protein